MPRPKHPLLLAAEYYPLRWLFTLLQWMPLSWAKGFGRLLLTALVGLSKKRRALIKTQIEACFPERSAAQRDRIAKESFDCLATGLATFVRIRSMGPQGIDSLVVRHGFEHLDAALARGRGAITFTAHMGCWEAMAVHVTQHYPRVAMLVRPIENARVNALVHAVRGSGGGGVVDSRLVFSDGIKVLRDNGILGILVDQNFYKGGVFVDFFGRPAATSTLVPILARRTGCAVIPMHNVWKDGKVHITCDPPLQLSAETDRAAAILADTQTMTHQVEQWIRESPGQWMWLHNRWKRRPLAS